MMLISTVAAVLCIYLPIVVKPPSAVQSFDDVQVFSGAAWEAFRLAIRFIKSPKHHGWTYYSPPTLALC